jgi:hypothetical protein
MLLKRTRGVKPDNPGAERGRRRQKGIRGLRPIRAMRTRPARARLGWSIALLALTTACTDTRPPTAPTPPPPDRPAGVSAPQGPLPPISGPARVFTYVSSAASPLGVITSASRYVLYDDGTFALQYPGPFEYRGTYTALDGAIRFDFAAHPGGVWQASATLDGGTLAVRYNLDMFLSDFEDAIYRIE